MTENNHHLYGPSSLARRELCPASARLEKDLPGFDTEDAKLGTQIHAEVAEMITIAKDKGYDETIAGHSEEAIKCFHKYTDVLSENSKESFNPETGNCSEIQTFTEKHLEYKYCGIVQFSGTADVLIVTDDKVVVIDWKTGHRFVEDAENNDQTAAYALAAMQTFGKEKADVYIYNPVIGQDQQTVFTDKASIAQYIMGIISKCEDPDAPICPSEDACRYCKAAYHGTCPALAKETAAVAVKAEELVPLPSLAELTVDDLCELKRKCDLIAKLGERVDSRIKTICEESGQCGKWKLKEISGGREITDINQAFSLSGMTADSFLGCCSCSISKLEKAYGKDGKESGKFKTEKDAKADLNEKLAMVIADKPRKKTLVQIGGLL